MPPGFSFFPLVWLAAALFCALTTNDAFSITVPAYQRHSYGFRHTGNNKKSSLCQQTRPQDVDMDSIGSSILKEALLSSSNTSSGKATIVNQVIELLWENIALAAESMIVSRLEPRFQILPGSLKSLHFSKVQLGTIPCQVSNVVVHPIQDDGSIKLDLDVTWHGECEIQLTKDLLGSFGIRQVNLEGKMVIYLHPLLPVLPCMKAFHFSFVNPPKISLEFTDNLAQLPNFKFVDDAIRKVLYDTMNEMIVLPVRISYNLFDQDEDSVHDNDAYSFKESYQLPKGIARVSILQGRGFVNKDIGATIQDVPDVYCKVKLGSSPEWRTSTVPNSLAPEWDTEAADFLLSDLGQEVVVQAFNENIDADDELGTCRVTVRDILTSSDDDDKTIELELLQENDDGDEQGSGAFLSLKCDTFPLTMGLDSLRPSNKTKLNDDFLCGLLVVLVTNARDIPVPREEAQTYVKVTVLGANVKKEFYTGTITDYRFYGADALNPEYDCAFHVPVTSKMLRSDETLTASWKIKRPILWTISLLQFVLSSSGKR